MYTLNICVCVHGCGCLTAHYFLLAILSPLAKLLTLCPTQVVGAARPPVWARVMLHIGPEDENSCHTRETNNFLGVLVLRCVLISVISVFAGKPLRQHLRVFSWPRSVSFDMTTYTKCVGFPVLTRHLIKKSLESYS